MLFLIAFCIQGLYLILYNARVFVNIAGVNSGMQHLCSYKNRQKIISFALYGRKTYYEATNTDIV